jgi:cell division protein FtsB
MSGDITDKELELAAKVNDLSDAAARPVVTGGGLFAQAGNFLMRRVSRGIITAVLMVFIAYHGWEAFNGSQQALAKLKSTRADAGAAVAKATALNTRTMALDNKRAEIEKLKQQAAAIQVEADAQRTIVGDSTVKLQTLRAEISKTKAEAQAAKIEADAQMQIIGNMPANVAQKKAEVETLEEKAKAIIAALKQQVEVQKSYIGISKGLCGQGFC